MVGGGKASPTDATMAVPEGCGVGVVGIEDASKRVGDEENALILSEFKARRLALRTRGARTPRAVCTRG